jgi:chromosomal replication initiation ATPase DnaA
MDHASLTAEIIADAFGELMPDHPSIELVLIAQPPDIRDVFGMVAAYYGVDHALMRNSRRRKGRMSRARQVVCYFCRSFGKPHKRIARVFGFDHSTVYAAARKIEAQLPHDECLRDDIDILRLRLHDLVWSRIRGMTCH